MLSGFFIDTNLWTLNLTFSIFFFCCCYQHHWHKTDRIVVCWSQWSEGWFVWDVSVRCEKVWHVSQTNHISQMGDPQSDDLTQMRPNFFAFIVHVPVTDPRFAKGGGSSGPPEKCVIWASEYNMGPQKWGVRGARGSPLDPPTDVRTYTNQWMIVNFLSFLFFLDQGAFSVSSGVLCFESFKRD